ncbi:cytochrome c [Trinickia fusca]|uniref:Cytochrome c n=1 Tax=Trinickia fusca TaxID=2419777 RepID=A0A494XBQ4_9BURK|nr:cytochrome c [Trinickia fusca]
MHAKWIHIARVWAAPVLAAVVVAVIGSRYLPASAQSQTAKQTERVPPVRFAAVDVTLPSGETVFPPGKGSEIANANCVICHSTGMVLRQPALTVDEWHAEIDKMRNAFGAPIPADQVDELAHYLSTINGRKLDGGPSGVDHQAN